MDAFLLKVMDWRVNVIHRYFSSRKCCPCFHDVASIKLDGRRFSGCSNALSPMWSRVFKSSSKFWETVGRHSQCGLLSHSGCFARMVETSVVDVMRSASCSMSRFMSFPTIVQRILNRNSSQSVPSKTKKNGWFGWLIFAFAMQKNAFLTIILTLTKRGVRIKFDCASSRIYSAKIRCTATLRCSSYSDSERLTHVHGNMR